MSGTHATTGPVIMPGLHRPLDKSVTVLTGVREASEQEVFETHQTACESSVKVGKLTFCTHTVFITSLNVPVIGCNECYVVARRMQGTSQTSNVCEPCGASGYESTYAHNCDTSILVTVLVTVIATMHSGHLSTHPGGGNLCDDCDNLGGSGPTGASSSATSVLTVVLSTQTVTLCICEHDVDEDGSSSIGDFEVSVLVSNKTLHGVQIMLTCKIVGIQLALVTTTVNLPLVAGPLKSPLMYLLIDQCTVCST